MWQNIIYLLGSGSVGTVAVLIVKHLFARQDARDAKREKEEQAREAEQANIKDGMLALLHDRLYSIYEECAKSGTACVEVIRNAEYLYNPYHALGGNGTGTELYAEDTRQNPHCS